MQIDTSSKEVELKEEEEVTTQGSTIIFRYCFEVNRMPQISHKKTLKGVEPDSETFKVTKDNEKIRSVTYSFDRIT